MPTNPEITITEAVTAYDLNRSTLMLWIRQGKLHSRKTQRGKLPVHLIETASLEALLQQRKPARKQLEKPGAASGPGIEESPPPGPVTHGSEAPEDSVGAGPDRDPAVPPPAVSDNPGPGHGPAPSSQPKPKPMPTRHRRKGRSLRQRAKDYLRSFPPADLRNVKAWIDQRLARSSQ